VGEGRDEGEAGRSLEKKLIRGKFPEKEAETCSSRPDIKLTTPWLS
jgi:hypothetical protein